MKVIFLSNDDADLQINLAAMVHSLDSCPVADLGEGPGGPGPPLFWVKKVWIRHWCLPDIYIDLTCLS